LIIKDVSGDVVLPAVVFHINCNLIKTSLYYNLFRELSSYGFSQSVWVPHKKYHQPENVETINNVNYQFSGHQDVFDRLLFHRKIRKGICAFQQEHLIRQNSLIHAHTLFSDGALAYEFHKKFDLPYVVTVRNTDLNIFWRYFPHLRKYAIEILRNASSIIFLSPAYLSQLTKKLSSTFYEEIDSKIHVVPNGIDPIWLLNPPLIPNKKSVQIRVLFVGQITKNKNIKSLVAACRLLRNEGYDVTLRIIGATDNVGLFCDNEYSWVDFLPFCNSKLELAEHYRWADVFAMPSLRETFGLVYAEALSQGTPVVYTKGQGFDGWVDESVCGKAILPKVPTDIASSILYLYENYNFDRCIDSVKQFDWKLISERYVWIYEKANDSHVRVCP
jgi:L-malate glycosyltransferase